MLFKTLIVATLITTNVDSNCQTFKQQTNKQQNFLFNGDYEGNATEKPIVITLKTTAKQVTGSLIMNGEMAYIHGTFNGNLAKGKITEGVSKKTYEFSASQQGDNLTFSITFPEYANIITTFKLQKAIPQGKTNISKKRDPNLFGTWRYTEVISSGSGQFYSSFSTDYFAKFNADGSALVWTGKSAGGTKDVTIDGKSSSKAQQMLWYTNGKTLFLVDANTKKEAPVTYYAESNRIMLSDEKNKKVYQRVSN